MNHVTVYLFAAARAAVGQDTVIVSVTTLGEAIDSIIDQFPPFAAVAPRCSYLIDEVAAHGDPHQIRLGRYARVDVLPPFAGG